MMWQNTNFYRQLFIRSALVLLVGIGFWRSNPQAVAQASTADQIEDVAHFEEEKCSKVFSGWFPWYRYFLQRRFRCGYLVTGENYDTPSSTQNIRLKVMVALSKKTTSESKSEPIIYLDGGPGSTGILKKPDEALSFADTFGRDFIQFGQRGSYFSEPYLYCEEYRNLILNNWERNLKQAEWDEMIIESLGNCLKRMNNQLTFENIINFNSKYNASDVINLLDSLGYENANLYGHSYGTLLAQHILVLSPEKVSNIVLDGVVPLGLDVIADEVHNRQRALGEIFEACNSDSNCDEAYPNLESLFNEVIVQLNKKPAQISVKDIYYSEDGRKHSKTYSNVNLNGDGFVSAITAYLYDRNNIKKVPKVLYAASQGNFEEIGENYLSAVRSQFFAWGMYYSVYCTEFANFESDKFLTKVCNEYEGANNRSYGDVKITNNRVPVLIFNGRFDPVTPPDYGKQVTISLSIDSEFNLTSQLSSHGTTISSDCEQNMMKDFFENPSQSPKNNSCWRKEVESSIQFELPDFVLTDWLNQRWEEIQKLVEDTWNRIKEEVNQRWKDFIKWLEDLVENWWQDFLHQLIQKLEELLTELLNQCLPSALLPTGVAAGVWISRRRKQGKK